MARKIDENNILAVVHPDLAAEWHPTKNGDLTPSDVTSKSGQKVWWICSKGHEWQATINNRSNGRGCPYCAGKKAIKGENDLATVNPQLASEWHPTKNGDLTPFDVTSGSERNVWWRCEKGHEWQARVFNRTKGQGCPYCSGRYPFIIGETDLATVKPELAAEWHPTKNGNIRPSDVHYRSNKKAWWLGKCGHEWQSQIGTRSNGTGCPYCSGLYTVKGETDLATLNPQLASEWHPTRNGDLTPYDVPPQSNRKVWWICSRGHEWQARVERRSIGQSCPYCSGQRVIKGETDLATVKPKLAAEWHPEKNGDLLPSDVMGRSGKKVWWKCSACGHEWQARIVDRSYGKGCPGCRGRKQKSALV